MKIIPAFKILLNDNPRKCGTHLLIRINYQWKFFPKYGEMVRNKKKNRILQDAVEK